MLMLTWPGRFAIAAGTATTTGQGFWSGGQQGKDQSQAEIAHRRHERSGCVGVVWRLLGGMHGGGHPGAALGVNALAVQLTPLLKGRLKGKSLGLVAAWGHGDIQEGSTRNS